MVWWKMTMEGVVADGVCGVLEVVCGGDDVVEMVLWRLCVCVEIVWWR